MNRLILASIPIFFSARCGLFGKRKIIVLDNEKCFRSSHLLYEVGYVMNESYYDIRPIIFTEPKRIPGCLGDLEF